MLSIAAEVAVVSAIDGVPMILEAIGAASGMRFAGIARIADSRWVCCASRDAAAGVALGDQMALAETPCPDVQRCGGTVLIEDANEEFTRDRPPLLTRYGFRSYVSVPIRIAGDREVWGTLWVADPGPKRRNTVSVAMLEVFARFIADQLKGRREAQAAVASKGGDAKDRYLAMWVHDMRTPLQSLQLGLTLLKRRATAPDLRLDGMLSSVGRISELVQQVDKSADGAITVDRRDVPDLARHLAVIVEEARTAWPNHVIRYEAGELGALWCDPDRLAQLAANLLENAVRHGTEDTPVLVKADRQGDTFSLVVTNSGPPIPEESKAGLYLPYVQGTEARDAAGLGLGLFIVAAIARAHDGSMTINCDAGLIDFLLTMPATRAH